MADKHESSKDSQDSNEGLSMKDSKEILKMVDTYVVYGPLAVLLANCRYFFYDATHSNLYFIEMIKYQSK